MSTNRRGYAAGEHLEFSKVIVTDPGEFANLVFANLGMVQQTCLCTQSQREHA